MVKVKESPWADEEEIEVEQWLQQLAEKGYINNIASIRNACTLSALSGKQQILESGVSCLQQGLGIADILADLEADEETLIAAIIFGNVHTAELSIEDVEEQLGSSIAKLVKGIERMNAIEALQSGFYPQDKQQIDNVRKMLLAMVDDARVVLIKLAQRLFILRSSSQLPESMRQVIATETMEIYAPLANRLGIGGIKWEMEDLAFRYLQPAAYKEIARGLRSKRLERDKYVSMVVQVLQNEIAAMGIKHFEVYGRSKHIHSIYKKMTRKNISLDEIYDATAVRILVDTIDQCYSVLSIIHGQWVQIPAEFDDYIVNPKPNGYQSLHTAVSGPEGRVFEVQIRTFAMHDQAEMGVAAHWKYKENIVKPKESHERKIEWLRDVLAWHKEMTGSSSVEMEFPEDRVYVFTPNGDVIELPSGATPLDFAYYVHSGLGHRCRGARINGHIVPLTYQLKIGDKVEILTTKEERPSRDWLNSHLGYLFTSRAKAKVLHWFKLQDYDKNRAEGQAILEKEFKTLDIKLIRLLDIAEALHFKTGDDLLAALGRGDIKLSQILHKIQPMQVSESDLFKHFVRHPPKPETSGSDLRIEGVGNLLTHMARCCQPVPGDEVIGYITLGRGVSVHRKDCPNILHSTEKQKQRFLQVSWGQATRDHYLVDLIIKAYDRTGLLKDITSLLANEKSSVFALQSETNKGDNIASLRFTIEIDGLNGLSRILAKISQIPNVFEARRL